MDKVMKIKRSRKYSESDTIKIQSIPQWNMDYLTYPGLEATGIVRHLFSTRLGGVSEGCCSSMNLSFSRGDDPEKVLENYKRIASALQCNVEDIVTSDQTHTTNIRLVTAKDRGKGVTKARDYTDIDGLITNRQGVVLATFYADCVPLYFVDPVHKAIGLAHSGWKGTAHKMGECMVKAMGEAFGTCPKDIIAAIGPSICVDCYEVSEEVAIYFREYEGVLMEGKAPGKYQLNLWEANRQILMNAGVSAENIEVTDLCTCCNPEYLFSHRASQGKRGNLGAFLGLI